MPDYDEASVLEVLDKVSRSVVNVSTIKPHLNRFFHVAITLTFYMVIVVHILQGLNIL